MSRALAAATLLLLLAVPGEAPCAPQEANHVEAGTRGVARTVLRGNQIVEIPLEFLGRLVGAAGPGHDLYLVRLEGENVEQIGVAGGMSGSPVYVDDEIVGALSYRMGFFPKEAIAGVTPIEDMYEAGRSSQAPARTTGGLAPIVTPVFVGGMVAAVREFLEPHLERHGMVVVAGGGTEPSMAPAPLEPGAPLGVHLVRGDLDVAATGTVTRVDGDRVLAFGHPFLGTGRVELPMVNAEIVHTLAAMGGSVKLSNVGPEVGAILEDRLTAVVGSLGHRARMVPVALQVGGGDHGRQDYHFEVVREPTLTPVLTGAAVANALAGNLGFDSEATVRVSGEIRTRGSGVLPLDFVLTSDAGSHPYLGIANRLAALLGALYANPFSKPDVESVDLNVAVERARRQYQLVGVRHSRGVVAAGDVIEIECTLETFRGGRQEARLQLAVPRGIARGTVLSLVVGNPAAIAAAVGQPVGHRLRTAPDLAAYLRALGERGREDRLEAVLLHRAASVVAAGELYSRLPPTAAYLLARQSAGSRRPQPTRTAALARSSVRLGGPVEGQYTVRLTVDGVDPEERK